MSDPGEVAYLLCRLALSLLTTAAAVATGRYGLTQPPGLSRRGVAFGGAAMLAAAAGLSVYDAFENTILTPGRPPTTISWLWLFGFDMLLPAWAFMLLRARRERDAAEDGLRRMAVTDPLTGALNRRGFLDRAERVLAQARRSGQPVTLAMLDIDRFKAINDGFGHDAGDAVLAGLSRVLSEGLRGGDLLARFGGEEFVLLMPGLAPESVDGLMGRLREDLRARVPHPAGAPAVVTVSGGIATVAVQASPRKALEQAISAADAALYAAKGAGRDRVFLAPLDSGGSARP